MLLNVSFYRKEVFADEFGSLLIFIRLGIQPSTGSSRRSRAEIQQNGAGLLFRCGQCLIDVLAPIHTHHLPPSEVCGHDSEPKLERQFDGARAADAVERRETSGLPAAPETAVQHRLRAAEGRTGECKRDRALWQKRP
jgi:hypothetical protein